MNIKKTMVGILFFMTVMLTIESYATELTNIKWKEGPDNIRISNIANLNLDSGYVFADKDDTIKIMESIGNTSNTNEIGSVFPKNRSEDWFVVFEYYESGHIKDSESDKLNVDDLLKTITLGAIEANNERVEKGYSPVLVKKWVEVPNYNKQFHSLVWGVMAETADGDMVNYESRILSREGYVSATLVCASRTLQNDKMHLKDIISKFSFQAGKRYEDYEEGKDILSDLGLEALVLGRIGVAGEKGLFLVALPFLEKSSIVVIVSLIIYRIWRLRRIKISQSEILDDNDNVVACSENENEDGNEEILKHKKDEYTSIQESEEISHV